MSFPAGALMSALYAAAIRPALAAKSQSFSRAVAGAGGPINRKYKASALPAKLSLAKPDFALASFRRRVGKCARQALGRGHTASRICPRAKRVTRRLPI